MFLSKQVIIIIIVREAIYCSASGTSKMYVTLYVSIKKINYLHIFYRKYGKHTYLLI